MAEVKQEATGAENVRWNLADLYPSIDAAEVKADITDLEQRIAAFDEKYRDKVATLSAAALLEAIETFEELVESITRLTAFASLNWAVDTVDPQIGRFLTTIQQQTNTFQQQLLFFELEWKQAPEDVAKLADTPTLSQYKHYLQVTRLTAPYTLSEPEEKIISELSMTGVQGWNRYFGEVMSQSRYEFEGESVNQSQILKHQSSPDREVRRKSADSLTAGLAENTHTTTYIFNMLGQYKQSLDKMRGFPTWISSRNLSNQVDDETVEALVDAVTSRYDIVHRYYRLAKELLGYDELYEYDRYAPIMEVPVKYSWDEARDLVMTAYRQFDPRMADIAAEFFDKNWIDAAILPNKRGGAFSAGTVPSVHPYILMNYTGEGRDVMTLAHELGHGVHQYLARKQGLLQFYTPLTTAEMASTFGEMLVFENIMEATDDPRARLSMRLNKIGNTFATVFRQIAMNRFEDGYHSGVREQGQLTTEQLSEIWLDTQTAMFGDSLTLREDYGLWWSYVPHFLNVPGYVYAYSFGELLVWTLYAIYQSGEIADFQARYLDALSKGGSMWPHDLLAPLKVDLKDPDFWHEGLNLIEDMIALAETEAAALNNS